MNGAYGESWFKIRNPVLFAIRSPARAIRETIRPRSEIITFGLGLDNGLADWLC